MNDDRMDLRIVTFEERPDLFDEQEQICGRAFPQSGEYVVEGALCPVIIDREQDLGRYLEPNVWVAYYL